MHLVYLFPMFIYIILTNHCPNQKEIKHLCALFFHLGFQWKSLRVPGGALFPAVVFTFYLSIVPPCWVKGPTPSRIRGASLSDFFLHIFYLIVIIAVHIPPMGHHGDGKEKQKGQLHPHHLLVQE